MSYNWSTRLRVNKDRLYDVVGNDYTNQSVPNAKFNPFNDDTLSSFFNANHLSIYSTSSSILNLSTSTFTVSFWMYLNTISAYGTITILGNSTNSSYAGSFIVYFYYPNQIVFLCKNTATHYQLNQVITSAISFNKWYHVGIVRTGNSILWFFNGILIFTSTLTASIYFGSDNDVSIGNYKYFYSTSPDQLAGYIYDYCIIKDSALWTSNFTPPTGYLLNNLYYGIKDNYGNIYSYKQ